MNTYVIIRIVLDHFLPEHMDIKIPDLTLRPIDIPAARSFKHQAVSQHFNEDKQPLAAA